MVSSHGGIPVAEKDILEKTLEDYNDVFADIVNGLLFHGEQKISPKDLVEAAPYSMYKTENGVHEEERDVAKYWMKKGQTDGKDETINVRLCLLGLENQTQYDQDMPLRVIGYDGAAYRAELDQAERYPVITLVLNFGSRKWGKSKSLYQRISVPEELKPYVSDYRINVFDIAFLSDEEIALFHSDFKIVADYFAHHRTNENYRPTDPQKFKHTDEALKLFSVLTKDSRFVETLKNNKGGKPNNMWEALDIIEEKGEKRGEKRGIVKGENKLSTLINKLFEANREDEVLKVTNNIRYRNKLYKEFQIT